MKKGTFIVLLLFFTQFSFGQLQRADQYFNSGDYINAAILYEPIWKKNQSKEVLQKLADCYYNTFKYNEANRALSALVTGRFKESDKYYDNKYNFMYYQFLSATGDYEKAIDYMALFKNNRGITPPLKEVAKDEVETFRLKKSDYTIKKATFNSEAAEFSALKLRDTVYFSSDRRNSFGSDYKWTHRPFLDIYSYRTNKENKQVSEPEQVSKVLNSKLHEGSFCFSKDGNTMYLSRSNLVEGDAVFDENKNNNIQLYSAKKIDGKWSEPKKLPFNLDEYNYEHPALSPDEKRLYFSSNELGSVGSYDLYYVTINDDGSYGNLKNLSYIINTANREQFPYISPEGHLFFASNGHLGLGMLDIFVSEWIDGQFTKPINVGAPINSRYDDFSLRYYDEKNGFFASNRDKVNDDVFEFEQIGELFEREYINTFEVRDVDTQEYVADVQVNLMLNNESVYQNTLDSLAQFNINLLSDTYKLTAIAKGYDTGEMSLEVKEENNQLHTLYLKKNNEITTVLSGQSEESQAVINALLNDKNPPKIVARDGKLYFDMPPIYFDFDRWEIRADSKVILSNLAEKLVSYPSLYIRITSHTDSRGTPTYNQVLSEKRAESTRNYITQQSNIDGTRVSFRGFGESKPLEACTECTEEQHQLNRRSEFEIIKY
tara:strand:+ start:4722 stop:6698 length:1977 start_codon:yes stop_codon:yes gene_type:complete